MMSINQLFVYFGTAAYCIIGFIIFFIVLLYYVKKQETELPQECYLEKIFGKKHYEIKVLSTGLIICLITVLLSKPIPMLFIALVIPIGLLFIKQIFYKYKLVIGTYNDLMKNPSVNFVLLNSTEKNQKQVQQRWNKVMKANIFQVNHPVIFLFILIEFILPSIYFGLQDGLFLTILIAFEYYFIGMALWVSMVGTVEIYWLGRYFPLTVSQDMKPYDELGKISFWTALLIAIVPGIGIPSIANIELILTSPPVQIALFCYTLANLTIFFTAIIGVHTGMVLSKQWIFKASSNKYSTMVSELLKKGKTDWGKLDEKEKRDLKNLSIVSQSFRRIYEGARNLNEWPLTLPLTIGGVISAFLPVLFTLLRDVLMRYLGT
jgi:hypothetical protein